MQQGPNKDQSKCINFNSQKQTSHCLVQSWVRWSTWALHWKWTQQWIKQACTTNKPTITASCYGLMVAASEEKHGVFGGESFFSSTKIAGTWVKGLNCIQSWVRAWKGCFLGRHRDLDAEATPYKREFWATNFCTLGSCKLLLIGFRFMTLMYKLQTSALNLTNPTLIHKVVHGFGLELQQQDFGESITKRSDQLPVDIFVLENACSVRYNSV